MASIIPFPYSKRVDLFPRVAHYIANMHEPKRGPNIEKLVDTQVRTMQKRGIDEALIEQEITYYRHALAAHLQHLLRRSGGGIA